jgi:adenylate cyclase
MAVGLDSLKRFFSPEHMRFLASKRIKPALQIGLSIGVLFCVFEFFDFNSMSENKTLDWRFVWKEIQAPAANDQVLIVAIDDQSMDRLKVRWPWPRTMYAKAIDRLSQAGAKVVAFDLVFSEPSQKELTVQDRILGDAILRSKSWIVLASKFFVKDMQVGQQIGYISPIPNIDPNKTHVGYVNLWHDKDGIIRHAALIQKHLNKPYQSFALKILARYYNLDFPLVTVGGNWVHFGSIPIPVDGNANLLINFRGGPGSFKVISFENLLDDEVFQGMQAAGIFKDKIILIGPTFTEAQDNHPTPYFMDYGVTPGVEIHANVLDTVINQKYFHRLPGLMLYGLLLLLPLVTALISIHLKPLHGLAFFILFALLYVGAGFGVFLHGRLILPLANPVIALLATYLIVLMYRVLSEERRSRQIKGMFSRYVSPKVVEELIKNPSAAMKLGGNKQEVTILFSDIRGFTSLSEQLAPEEVVELLNEYFQAMTDVIFKHDGTVDKFIGDAIMAIFGAPVAHGDDPMRAVRTAVAMLEELKLLRAKWEARGRRTFEIGVGINTGEAIVGNMGSIQAMGYTVIGDAVNLASRLESANKELGTHILISESTYRQVAAQVEAREIPGIKVKGKANAFSVYEILNLK